MRTWLAAAALLVALSGCTAVVDGTGTVAGSALSGGGASSSDGTQTDSGSGHSGLVRFHGNGFSILLPGAPVRNDVPLRTAGGKVKVTLHVLTVELNGTDGYVFGYVDYPPSAS